MRQDSLTARLAPSRIGLAWGALCIVYFSDGGFGVRWGNISKDTAPCGGNDGTMMAPTIQQIKPQVDLPPVIKAVQGIETKVVFEPVLAAIQQNNPRWTFHPNAKQVDY